MTTTDKVYNINLKKKIFKEDDDLGGNDPYSASKAALEILIQKYIYKENLIKKNKRLGIVCCRAGNVIGGGDFSLNRLVPDIVRANFRKKTLKIRFKNAVRPWQHVFDPLYEYILIAQLVSKNKIFSGCYNFGPLYKNHVKVSNILSEAKKRYKKLKINYVVNNIKETKLLRLNTKKIDKILNRKNRKINIKYALNITFNWYDHLKKKPREIIKFSFKQIDEYFKNKLKFG